jgi:glutamate dehydrogenase/leucine dehydrogenase
VMRRTYREVSTRAEIEGLSLRKTAFKLAIERVVEASRTRGYIDS